MQTNMGSSFLKSFINFCFWELPKDKLFHIYVTLQAKIKHSWNKSSQFQMYVIPKDKYLSPGSFSPISQKDSFRMRPDTLSPLTILSQTSQNSPLPLNVCILRWWIFSSSSVFLLPSSGYFVINILIDLCI